MTTLIVSDLHLSAARPDRLALFFAFVDRARRTANAVYILGDLFDVWLGDDDDTEPHPQVVDSLRRLSEAGVALFVSHGNRDFLFGARFAKATGCSLLGDYATLDIHGERALLMHGDLLCTRDISYQRFRAVVRNPLVRATFLATPLAWRKWIARRTRSGTQASMQFKSDAIMDVEAAAVVGTMAAHGVTLLVHGHTHRPAVHHLEVDGRACRRIVLGDWYEQDSVLVCDERGQRLERVSDFLGM